MQVCAYHLLVVVFLPKHSMIENVIVASFICKHSFSFICTDGAKTDVTGGCIYLLLLPSFTKTKVSVRGWIFIIKRSLWAVLFSLISSYLDLD